MRHKTSGYFLLSALLVSLILGLCILLNLRCPQAVSDDALTQEQLTRGVTLTGWQQTGPGHWRFAFEAPADFLRTDDPQTIRAELTDIRDTAYDISARMMRSLEQSKAPRLSEQER